MNKRVAIPILIVIVLVLASVPSQSVLQCKCYGICWMGIRGEKGGFSWLPGKVRVKVNETVTIKVSVSHLPYRRVWEGFLKSIGIDNETIRVCLYIDGKLVKSREHTYQYQSDEERCFSIEHTTKWTQPGTHKITARAELLDGGLRSLFHSEESKIVEVVDENTSSLLVLLQRILPFSIKEFVCHLSYKYGRGFLRREDM